MTPGGAEPLADRVAALEAALQVSRSEVQSLTARLSHDLRAPLRHITSFAQLLKEEAGAQLQGDAPLFLDNITAAAQSMAQMLDALMEFSRVGTAPVHLQPVDLAALLDGVVRERQMALAELQLPRTVEWVVAAQAPSVVADAPLLRQALTRVLDNAVQFTAPVERATIQVEVESDHQAGTVRCTVRDNGVGFAPHQAVQLFQPFIRLHSARQGAGQGMGLALVRKSLERMGGSVQIEAEPNAGCRLYLVLPLA